MISGAQPQRVALWAGTSGHPALHEHPKSNQSTMLIGCFGGGEVKILRRLARYSRTAPTPAQEPTRSQPYS